MNNIVCDQYCGTRYLMYDSCREKYLCCRFRFYGYSQGTLLTQTDGYTCRATSVFSGFPEFRLPVLRYPVDTGCNSLSNSLCKQGSPFFFRKSEVRFRVHNPSKMPVRPTNVRFQFLPKIARPHPPGGCGPGKIGNRKSDIHIRLLRSTKDFFDSLSFGGNTIWY